MHEMQPIIYTDQTGKFPHVSIRGNRHQFIVHYMDINSTWFEPFRNRTEGGLILTQRRALARMKLCGVVPKNEVLDNEISRAYKDEI